MLSFIKLLFKTNTDKLLHYGTREYIIDKADEKRKLLTDPSAYGYSIVEASEKIKHLDNEINLIKSKVGCPKDVWEYYHNWNAPRPLSQDTGSVIKKVNGIILKVLAIIILVIIFFVCFV